MSHQPGNPPPYQQGYGTTNVVVTQPQPQVVVMGTCASCGVGRVTDNFTVLGIILAILFFPLGILCCFLLMEKRCDRCGASY